MTTTKAVARRIEESDNIRSGQTIIFKHYNLGKGKREVVTRTTKKFIFIGESKYSRAGYFTGDEYKRCVLFVEA